MLATDHIKFCHNQVKSNMSYMGSMEENLTNRGPFHKQFFHHNLNVMKISFYSHPNTNKVITTIFGTLHDSWAVVRCAKFCCDMVISN